MEPIRLIETYHNRDMSVELKTILHMPFPPSEGMLLFKPSWNDGTATGYDDEFIVERVKYTFNEGYTQFEAEYDEHVELPNEDLVSFVEDIAKSARNGWSMVIWK